MTNQRSVRLPSPATEIPRVLLLRVLLVTVGLCLAFWLVSFLLLGVRAHALRQTAVLGAGAGGGANRLPLGPVAERGPGPRRSTP